MRIKDSLRRLLARRTELVKLGSEEAGWIVPLAMVSPDSVCYCAGVGEDTSFEEALIERVGCHVFTFDPTPRALAHVKKRYAESAIYAKVHHFCVGLWSDDGPQRFSAPVDPAHVSHSIVNLQQTREGFDAPCLRLSSIQRLLGHQQIDLLKMDIEGAEAEVLRTVHEDAIRPRIVCVEFDEARVRGSELLPPLVSLMTRMGYAGVAVDGWNYTFVRR